MALGFSSTVANAILNAFARNTTWTQPTAVYVQLHTADPGAAGTTSIATETDRVQATFGTGASGGVVSNTAAVTWTGVAGAEDFTHISLWDASTSGNFLMSGTMTANAVQIGDDFVIPIGDLDLSLLVAA